MLRNYFIVLHLSVISIKGDAQYLKLEATLHIKMGLLLWAGALTEGPKSKIFKDEGARAPLIAQNDECFSLFTI